MRTYLNCGDKESKSFASTRARFDEHILTGQYFRNGLFLCGITASTTKSNFPREIANIKILSAPVLWSLKCNS